MKNDVAEKKEKERKNLSSHVKIEAERVDGAPFQIGRRQKLDVA